jgi:hypothetical protein
MLPSQRASQWPNIEGDESIDKAIRRAPDQTSFASLRQLAKRSHIPLTTAESAE